MLKREVILTELKPDCVDEYRRYHEAVWPELEQVYREAGYQEISCFVCGTKLIIYMVCDEELMADRREWMDRHPVQRNWQEIMEQFKCDTVFEFEEIYRFSSRIEDEPAEMEL